MKVVPRGLELMAVKRPLGLTARVHERAVPALNDHAQGLKYRPFVSAEKVHREQLPFGIRLTCMLRPPTPPRAL